MASGSFFGRRLDVLRIAGFSVGLWRATRSPEEVTAHIHEDAHFVFAIDSGYRSIAIDDRKARDKECEAGALIWNPPGVEHRDSFASVGGRFLSVSFEPWSALARTYPVRLRGNLPGMAARKLVGHVATFRRGAALPVENLMLDIVGSVLSPPELDEDPAPDWLWRAVDAICDLAPTPGLEVRHIAELIGVHPVSLARHFRRHFDCSPASAIRRCRVDRAAAALVRDRPLADLALEGGFADQSHFTRDFRTTYGVTPRRFRNAIR